MSMTCVTGAAGFIGFHLCRRLLEDGRNVVAVDSLNDYYDVRLKRDRLAQLTKYSDFEFVELDLADRTGAERLFAEGQFDVVLHMAAQAGVRYSLDNPHAYADSNLTAFLHVLEGCRQTGVQHLVYASSSSVYGDGALTPSKVTDRVDHPLSLYAATKRANELMAHAYSHLYGFPTTGLRFFTVYGPWGRPDMAIYKFAEAILNGRPIDVYNHGRMRRSFTYIDDVVEGVVRLARQVPANPPDGKSSAASPIPYRLYNIGNNQSVELEHVIALLERALGKKAQRNDLGLQPGDVLQTCADISDLAAAVGYDPATPIEIGIERFVEWYLSYRGAGLCP